MSSVHRSMPGATIARRPADTEKAAEVRELCADARETLESKKDWYVGAQELRSNPLIAAAYKAVAHSLALSQLSFRGSPDQVDGIAASIAKEGRITRTQVGNVLKLAERRASGICAATGSDPMAQLLTTIEQLGNKKFGGSIHNEL